MAQTILFDYKQKYGVLPSRPRQLIAFSKLKANTCRKPITYVEAKTVLQTAKKKRQNRPKPAVIVPTNLRKFRKRATPSTPPLLQNSVSLDMNTVNTNQRRNKYKKHQLQHSTTNINVVSDMKVEESKESQKHARLRKHAVQELVSTEKTYLMGLEQLFKFYINPLKNSNDKRIRKLITREDHRLLFPSDLSTIYAMHIQLCADLTKYTAEYCVDTTKIGHIFIKYGHLFKMYQDYFHKHEGAVQHLMKLERKNPKFGKWSAAQSQNVSGLNIQSLLILPIQRLPRYEMLLKEIIKRTKQYHIDLYDLQEASEQITEVTELINDKMKEHDRRIKVAMVEKRFIDLVDAIGHFVQPSRIFIAESSECHSNDNYVVRHDKFGNRVPITIFLFNDCLIYGYYEHNRNRNTNDENSVSPKQKQQRKGKLRFGSILVFDPLFSLEDVPFNDDYNYKKISSLKIQARHHSMWVSFHSYDAKLKWFEMINQQNDILATQNLNARRRSATHKSVTSISPRSPQSPNELYLGIPVWVPDDYSDICMDCKAKFSMLRRRHHCYFCGKLCCDKCTKYKLIDIWKLYFEQKKEYVRVCEMCHVEREEYLSAKQNKYMYYASNEPQTNGNEQTIAIDRDPPNNCNKMDANDEGDCDLVGSENENRQLLSQSTFDITKMHQMKSRRVSQRRAKMGIHHKQKSLGQGNNM